MFEVDGSTIKITRGNKGAIGVVAEKEDEQNSSKLVGLLDINLKKE